jgi:catechol 2,3-dioxygenase-like lactoylglutathione lyase family enzyme
MRVLRVGYVGVRTEHIDETTAFFRDVLGLEPAGQSETVTFSLLPTGPRDFVEIYSPDHDDERMIPNGVDFVIAFVVDDLDQALAEIEAAGLELVGDVVWAAEAFGNAAFEGFGWFFVRAPDGHVYVIEQVPD